MCPIKAAMEAMTVRGQVASKSEVINLGFGTCASGEDVKKTGTSEDTANIPKVMALLRE